MPRTAKRKSKIKSPPKSSRDKVRAYRARKRREGLRLVQMWLPDQSSPEFRREALRQSRLINASKGEQEALDFIEAAVDWSDR
ncbi:MAG: antitoxin MazE family protein [Xanthobacteraceae bacterium]